MQRSVETALVFVCPQSFITNCYLDRLTLSQANTVWEVQNLPLPSGNRQVVRSKLQLLTTDYSLWALLNRGKLWKCTLLPSYHRRVHTTCYLVMPASKPFDSFWYYLSNLVWVGTSLLYERGTHCRTREDNW